MKTGHSFPAAFGFSGSSSDGPVPVRAYQRGGRVLPAKPASMKMQPQKGGAKKTLRQPVIPATKEMAANSGKKLMPGYKGGGKVKGALSQCR
jgi:hypothetical protein